MTRKLTFGRTSAMDRASITSWEKPWPEIAALFEKPVVRKITTEQYNAMAPKGRAHSKNTGLFFGGRCKDGHRSDSNLVSRSIVNLDIDNHAQSLWDDFTLLGALPGLEGLTYLVHTTRSHSEENPKLRVLIPLSRDVTPAEYEPVARALAYKLDTSMKAVARESYPAAQGMYFPSVSSDQDYEYALINGEMFDPDDALIDYPADDASTWPMAAKEVVTAYQPGRRMTHPEDKKAQAPIITAVHRAYDPWTFIEEFLGDVYIPSGERYSPVGATGAPSVRVYDDAFVQSDHGSDPAVGQHNTFDLGRIHLFGHLDEDFDTASLSPSDWPSYTAMVDFMRQDERVIDELVAVEAEVQADQARAALELLAGLDDLGDEPVEEAYDELIGEAPAKAAPTIEDVLARVKLTITNASSLNDLDMRLEKVRAIPTQTLRDFHRDMLVTTLQAKMGELTGEKPAKPIAKKMLAPTLENLRDQMASEPMPEWLDDWVFVTGENVMYNLVTKEALNREAFNGRFNKNTGDQFGSSDMGVAKLSAYDAATQVFCVPMPYGRKYFPGKEALFEDDGLLYANTYRGALVGSTAYKGREGVDYLLRLIADLFPAAAHQGMVLDFLAHSIRFPQKKLRYAMLVKGSEEEGKSLLGSLVGRLVGASNFGIVGTDQLTERFNSWSHNRVFCIVEEIKLPGKEAHEVLNKIKPVISNTEVPIRKMHKDATTERNFCNLYMTTNFEDCLPLEEDNTRFLVLFTQFQTNGQVRAWREKRMEAEGFDYVKRLWTHIQEHPAQFLEFFQQYTFSEHYQPESRAPWTHFKKIMADDAKTDERQLLEELLERGDQPGITRDVLIWSAFKDYMTSQGVGERLKGRAVSGFLKPLGFIRPEESSLMLNGRKQKVKIWTRNFDLLLADNRMSPALQAKAREALSAVQDMENTESRADNVVRLPRKK